MKVHAQAGQTGLSFLKLGVGARAAAMGEAQVAAGTDASSLHYNPAAIASLAASNLTLMHREWIQDVRTEYLAASVPLGTFTLGFHLNSTRVDDIEIRTRPGPPEGTFDAQSFATGFSAAFQLSSELDVGLTAKFLYEKIFVDEAKGFGLDLGALYRPTGSRFRAGASLTNVGSMSKLQSETSRLPTTLRVGSAYTVSVNSLEGEATFAADGYSVVKEGKLHVNAGGEFDYKQTVALRLGYLWNADGRRLTAGFGARHNFFRFDYAFSSLPSDLGDAHVVSLTVDL